jgi:hypothetical protein
LTKIFQKAFLGLIMSKSFLSTIVFISVLAGVGYFLFSSFGAGQKAVNNNSNSNVSKSSSSVFTPDLTAELETGNPLSIVDFEQVPEIPKTFEDKTIDDQKLYKIGEKYLGLVTSSTNPGILVIYNPIEKKWQKLFQPVNAQIGGRVPNNTIKAIWAGGGRIRMIYVDQFEGKNSEGNGKLFDSRDGLKWNYNTCIGWTTAFGNELINSNFDFEQAVVNYQKTIPDVNFIYQKDEGEKNFSTIKDGKKTILTQCSNLQV